MMARRLWWAVVPVLAVCPRAGTYAAPTPPLRATLYDFEAGVAEWRGNPWGGGQCGVEAAGEAAVGKGCLRGWFRDVEKGANLIAPELSADAGWRQHPWGAISLALRGDGSHGSVNLQLVTDEPVNPTYSRSVALEETRWHRVTIPLATLWNRDGRRLDPSRLRRIYFGGSGTRHFWADDVRLEAPFRQVPLTPASTSSAPGVRPLTNITWRDYGGGTYAAYLEEPPAGTPQCVLMVTWQMDGQTATAQAKAGEAEGALRETFVVVRAPAAREGEARVAFRLVDPEARVVGALVARYHVFLPVPAAGPPPLPILPTPKEARMGEGEFRLPRRLRIATPAGAVDGRVTRLLARELERWYGVETREEAAGDGPALVLVRHAKGRPAPAVLAKALAARLDAMPAEGYVLTISPGRAMLVANDDAGLYYAAQTFLQCVELATASPDAPRARCVEVVDWPSLPRRALSMSVPTDRWGHPNDAPVDPAFFRDFIERHVARRKLNTVVLIIHQGVRLDSHPEINGPAAWSKEEMRRFVQTCRDNFIEPIPSLNSYGHASWLTIPHKELAEDGDYHIACSSNPETFRILTDIFTELLDLFAPTRYFHVGLDEVWWKTLDTPPEKRCPRCAGIPKGKLFADQVKRLHGWLAARGVRTVMWSDVLLPEHNGGAPYHGAEALPAIPTDVVQANWSTTVAPGSNPRLRGRGFTVWQSNSRGVNREQALFCEGTMFGVWNKMAWWSDAPWRSAGSYTYLSFLPAAEYSWNLWPDVNTLQPPLSWEWLRAREETVLARDALDPEPLAGGETFSVPVPANLSTRASEPAAPEGWFGAAPDADLRHLPRGRVTVGGVPFEIVQGALDCAAPLPAGEGKLTIPVGRRAASLRFLHTAHLLPGREEGFLEGFKKGANWRGVPMGEYVISYEDGTTDRCPILYINNIKRWEVGEAIPYVFRSAGFLFAATERQRRQDPEGRDVALYVAQWVNPHPEKSIRGIEVTGCPDAVPVLFAVTGRSSRE